jgi:hypothetical protein
MKGLLLVLTLALTALVATACAGGAPATGTQPEGAPVSGFTLKLGTNPSPARIGQVELFVDVTDASGKPVDAAAVTMKADMIGHSMGDLSGALTPQGNGRYAASANLSMAGPWQVDVSVEADGKTAAQQFAIEVTE